MAQSLYKDVSDRYKKKIKDQCDGFDPFNLDFKMCLDPLPESVGFFDVVTSVVNYCVNNDSSYTNDSFKSYKALDAYKYYNEGWIKEIACRKLKDGFVVTAKVGHSQKMSAKPLHCWVSVDTTGIVLCGHCSCMAGLGEVCTHIGATLFLLAEWCRRSKELNISNVSCTDVLSKWVVPTNRSADMAKARDIVWRHNQPTPECIEPLPALTDSQIDDLLSRISVGRSCVLMAMRTPFSDKLVPVTSDEKFARLQPDDENVDVDVEQLFLPSLFSSEFEQMDLEYLQSYANAIDWSYSEQEISFIERATKLQRKSKLWFLFRAGRITGSTFKAVCRTRATPAISLINRICYPQQNQFTSKYTQYGIDNEEYARQSYVELIRENHTNFAIEESGLVINNSYPHFGVSPDGVTYCECCGRGSVEIKCPWTVRNDDWKLYLAKNDCPLRVDENGTYFVKEDHEYYYQMQLQIQLLTVNFCDFIIWNQKTTTIVRVEKNDAFWAKENPKADKYWKTILLPELLGHFFSNQKEKKLDEQKKFLALKAADDQTIFEKRQKFVASISVETPTSSNDGSEQQ